MTDVLEIREARTPLERVLWAARRREAARDELRVAIFAAAADGASWADIGKMAGCGSRYVGFVLAGKRLKKRALP